MTRSYNEYFIFFSLMIYQELDILFYRHISFYPRLHPRTESFKKNTRLLDGAYQIIFHVQTLVS